MNQKRIVIDGKVYNSVDEMPEDVRRQYEAALDKLDKDRNGRLDMLENMGAFFEDKNSDGIPDAFDGLTSNVLTTTRIVADGKEYNGMEELPPEVRAKLSQAMGKLDANRNGVPDFLEGTANTPNQTVNVGTGWGADAPPRSQPVPAPMIEPESTSGWMIALAGVLLLLMCAAGAVGLWYLFLR